jgi:hypothetical protein
MTKRDINKGLRDLGLENESARLRLAELANLVSQPKTNQVIAITAPHTNQKVKEVENAKLE